MIRQKKRYRALVEKLEQALVPVDEQPYEVPENWCWTKLKYGFEVTSSKRIHKSDWRTEGIPFYRTRELVKLSENGYVNNELFIEESLYERLVEENGKPNCGDLLVSGVGTIGVPYVVSNNERFYFKDGNVIWLKNNGLFNEKYMYYLFKSLFMKNQIYGMSAGTTVNTYTIVNAKETMLPLTCKEEQQRIVERIEYLFAKLDEVEKKLKITLDEMKTRKMSILHKAFRGELTIQWRSENNIDIDTWKEKQLDEICKSIFDGDHMPPPKSESGVHFLVISNVNTGYLSFENTRYVSQEYYDNLSETRKPEMGDILYTLVGSYGIPIVIDDDTPFCFQRHMGLLKPNKVDTYFLWYQMQSYEFYNKATDIANGTAQLTVPIKGLRKLKVRCPLEGEQKEIVRLLNGVFEKDDEIKKIVESVWNRVRLLKKSILAKAFRGELGTNNSDEESSIELLKQILEQEE